MPSTGLEKFNLSGATVLIVDSNANTRLILSQILMGFGVHSPSTATTVDGAMAAVKGLNFDLILVRAHLGDEDGYDLVEWLRRSGISPNCYTAVIVLSAHTPVSKVEKARDTGANFIVSAPYSPGILLERIVWISRQPRSYLQTGSYFGPDRRFHVLPADRHPGGRRSGDDIPDLAAGADSD